MELPAGDDAALRYLLDGVQEHHETAVFPDYGCPVDGCGCTHLAELLPPENRELGLSLAHKD